MDFEHDDRNPYEFMWLFNASITLPITVLHFGEIIAEGDKQSIQRNPIVQKAYLGD